MPQPKSELASLRAEIDEVDRGLLDLLARRADLALKIGAVKDRRDGGMWRPAREAELLRRLLAEPHGRFPRAALARIWRELFGAALSLQGPFSVAVYAPEGDRELVGLARSHFGIAARTQELVSARGVLRAVADGSADVALVPLPEDGEDDPWWPALVGQLERPLSIVARLPFAAQREDRFARGALAVSGGPPEPTGDDHSYFVLRTDEGVSRTFLYGLLRGEDLVPRFMAAASTEDRAVLYLVEVADFLAEDDERLSALAGRDNSPVREYRVLGSYAAPVDPDTLAGTHLAEPSP